MKKILFAITLIIATACGSTVSSTAAANSDTGAPKKTEALVATPKPDILLGKQDRAALEQDPFGIWFNKNFENYTVDTETVNQLSPYLKGVSIKAFMGTWCGDSKRETPTFYKILDQANFDYKNLELITVTRGKNTPEGYEKGLDIIKVPTFIFYKDGQEIGRYVEFARESLEKDMLAIISGSPYKHSYEN